MASEEMMHYGLSPYESWKISYGSAKRPSGAAIAGLVLGSVGTAAAIGAWVFGPVVANNRSRGVEMLANAQFNANQQQLNLLANLLSTERSERVAQGTTISQSITDSISGTQSSQLTAQQAAELSAVNSVMAQTYSDFVTGRATLSPTPVSLYTPAREFKCGCGCDN